MYQFILEADNLFRYEHPINKATGDPISSATVTARWYDDAKDHEVQADVDSASTLIPITFPHNFVVGDNIRIRQDDGTYHASTIASFGAASFTLNAATTFLIRKGTRIASDFTGTVSLTAYGTPDAATLDWGFQGTHQSTQQAKLTRGMVIRVEMFLDDGSGVDGFEWIKAKVLGPK